MSIRANALDILLLGIGMLAILAALGLSPTSLGELAGREEMSAQALFILRGMLLFAGLIVASIRLPFLLRHWDVFIFLIPPLAVLALALYKLRFGIEDKVYIRIVREDGLVEYLTFFVMAVACLLAAIAVIGAVRLKARIEAVLFACLAAFTLLVALEEISYGQRIFSFETPEGLRTVNSQGEFNIHNIPDLSDYSYRLGPTLVLSYGLFGWVLAAAVQSVAGVGSRLHQIADRLLPPWYTASYFLPLAIYRGFEMNGYPVDTCCGDGQFLIWQDQEPAELFFALGFLVFLAAALTTLRKSADPSGKRQ